MANQEHLDTLRQGVEVWNQWREEYPNIQPDLSGVDLEGADLAAINLKGTNLYEAHLKDAILDKAYIAEADLTGANLNGAKLRGAYLIGACLWRANLSSAILLNAQIGGANLKGASFDKSTRLDEIILVDKEYGSVFVADLDWGGANIAVIDWTQLVTLGDEEKAYQSMHLTEFKSAVRANRQLSILLQSQGMNEDANRFAYQANVLQRQVFQQEILQRLTRRQEELRRIDPNGKKLIIPIGINGEIPLTPILQFFMKLMGWPAILLAKVERTKKEAFYFKLLLFPCIIGVLLYMLGVLLPFMALLFLLLLLGILFLLVQGSISSRFSHSLRFLPNRTIQRAQKWQPIMMIIESFSDVLLPSTVMRLLKKSVMPKSPNDAIAIPVFLIFSETVADYRKFTFSLFLDLLAGYGYKPIRTACWYIVVILGFAVAYTVFGGKQISSFFPDAVVYSLTSFHGRGFFPGLGTSEGLLHNPLVVLAAFQAVIGLFMEISFIATFTQRFFGK